MTPGLIAQIFPETRQVLKFAKSKTEVKKPEFTRHQVVEKILWSCGTELKTVNAALAQVNKMLIYQLFKKKLDKWLSQNNSVFQLLDVVLLLSKVRLVGDLFDL